MARYQAKRRHRPAGRHSTRARRALLFIWSAPIIRSPLRGVKMGLTQDNEVSIDDGLKPGDVVVVDGAEKFAEGMSVTVRQHWRQAGVRKDESVSAVYSAAGCHVFADGGHPDRGRHRL